MPLQATSGAASYDAFGGGVPVEPVYIEQIFSTYLYTGNGSTQTITNGIDLSTKGGLVWIKGRTDATDHSLEDTLRTVSIYAATLSSNTTAAQSAGDITGFTTSGFSLRDYTGATNSSGYNYVSWTFRKQPKFFDVVTYTGNGTNGRTVAHSLGSVPACMIVKRTDASNGWAVYHRSMNASPQDYMMRLNATDGAFTTTPSRWNNTLPTSTEFTLSGNDEVNGSGGTYVAYLFAHNAGGFGLTGTDNVISCGSFTTDGSGYATVNLGYEPQWILWKRSDGATNWFIADSMRGLTTSDTTSVLSANLSNAEDTGYSMQPLSTGFKTGGAASATYIYIAIRRGPMKVPTSGTSVFTPIATSATTGTAITTNFPVDLQFWGDRGGNGYNFLVSDRLRGVVTSPVTATSPNLQTAVTAAEITIFNSTRNWNNTGYQIGSSLSGVNAAYWNFRRAPSFFDVVCYTGTGSARTVTHNLTVAPELMIMKRRDTTANWPVYTASTATNEYLFLNSGGLPTTATTVWNNTAPTASVFSVGTSALTNASAGTYVAYLFSSCAGVSKVGSYTGTGALQTINCGFTSGARFVLIKLISSGTSGSGDWYVWDSARGISSGNDPYLLLDSTSAEVTGTNYVDTDTTGFKVTAAGATDINANGDVYLFLAIA